MALDPGHVEWSRRQFAILKDGGVWGIPRSGMIFQRQGEELVLIDQMPWVDDMPITKEQLARQQQGDWDVVKAHFEAAGIPVRRATT
jgi:hypothetical protein